MPAATSNAVQVQVIPTAATPTFDPVAGTYGSAQDVAISSDTRTATIYYTDDGSTPEVVGGVPQGTTTLYTGPVTVSSSQTLQAIAVAPGYNNSAVGIAAYVISVTPEDFTVEGGFGTDLPNCINGGEDFAFYGWSANPPLDPGSGTPTPNPPVFAGVDVCGTFEISGNSFNGSDAGFILVFNGAVAQNAFTSITVQLTGHGPQTFHTAAAAYCTGSGTAELPLSGGNTWELTAGPPGGVTVFGWDTGVAEPHVNFNSGVVTTVTINP